MAYPIPGGWVSINKASNKVVFLNIIGVIILLILLIGPLWLFYFLNDEFIPLSDRVQFIILIIITSFGIIFLILAIVNAKNVMINNLRYSKFLMTYLNPCKDLEHLIIDGIGKEKIKLYPRDNYLKGLGKIRKISLENYVIFIMNNRGNINNISAIYVGPINNKKEDYDFLKSIDDVVFPINKYESSPNLGRQI